MQRANRIIDIGLIFATILMLFASVSTSTSQTACIFGEEFRCNDGMCIPKDWVCDKYPDCTECHPQTMRGSNSNICRPGEFRCNDGRCIPISWICDADLDCTAGEDEENCPPCTDDEYTCKQNGKCIPDNFMCDGYDDCPGGDDEIHCNTLKPCIPGDFICADGACIPGQRECDGYYNCMGGEDEENCTSSTFPIICEKGQINCGQHCIPKAWRCDSIIDCPGATDEQNCPNRRLPTQMSQEKLKSLTSKHHAYIRRQFSKRLINKKSSR